MLILHGYWKVESHRAEECADIKRPKHSTKGFKSTLVERLWAAVSESDDNNDIANP